MILKDAVVIGAGPAGTTVGKQLANEGFDVLIFEKASSPGHEKPCGGAISKNFYNKLDLPKEIVEQESSKLLVHYSSETIELSSKSGFILFDRERFDSFLAKKAVEKGAKLLSSTVVTDVVRNKDKMIIHYKQTPLQKTGKVQARLVIFADGTKTLAYEKYKLGFQAKPDCTVLAAACDLRWHNKPRDSLDFFVSEEISPFGYGWIFPKKHSINVGVTVLLSKMRRNVRFYLDHLLKLEKIESLQVIKYGFRLIPQSIVENIHGDSLMVIGDAAGTADPITGGGISNAIVNAKIAAEVATKALKNKKLTADFLEAYEKKWKATGEYQRIISKDKLQKLALKIGINPATAIKMGAFSSHESLNESISKTE